MAAMTLYTPPDFWRSYPVLIAAEYSNVSLRVVSGGPEFCSETGCTTPYFLKRFPQGKVPVLVADSGFCVQESNAIAYYVSSDVLRGSSRKEAALVQQWINFAESELAPPAAACALKFSKMVAAHAKKVLGLLNDHLHGQTYLVGEHITLADITLVCAMLGLFKNVLDPSLRESYADVDRWFTRCINQPPFQKVLAEVVFDAPAAQCTATKPLEAQDGTSEAARPGTGLDSTNEKKVGFVESGLDEVSAVEAHSVGSSAECGPVSAADPPRKHRLSLIDASEEELSIVCASVRVEQKKGGQQLLLERWLEPPRIWEVKRRLYLTFWPVGASQLGVPCRGAEEAATIEAGMVGASRKDHSSDLSIIDSQPVGPAEEAIAIMGSLEKANVVSLSILEPSEKGKACKQEATSASKEHTPTSVDVALLETSKQGTHMINPPLECGSIAASVADAPKDNEAVKGGALDKSEGGRLATEEPMRASRAHGDEWGSKSADQLKAKDPFAHLLKSTFVLDEFKWKYSNEDICSVALPYLWDHFDKDGWSVWYMDYKYPQELCLDFMSSNLITGLFQRLDGLRKHSFASVILFGTDGDSSISGIWILRGQQLASELNEDWQVTCEPYSWKKLDVDTDECKALINEYFMMEGAFQHVGKPFNQGKIFK
ncbi:elongation factor 1-gamma-like [Scyliorhinus torazame]|uniref:elongation factor 1-gamma-like n=1 Tax=Scyliorhinus torazame TaxID=75743 RepID=UPI003B591573